MNPLRLPAGRLGVQAFSPRTRAIATLAFSALATGYALDPASTDAAPIPINNHSFERATYVGTNSWTNNLVDPGPVTPGALGDWVEPAANGGDGFIERIGGFVSEGFAHVGLQNNYYIFQNTGVPYQPNTKYTLTVGVGNRSGWSPAGSLSIIGFTVLNEPPSPANFLDGLNANDQLLVDPVLAANHVVVDSGSAPWTVNTFRDVSVEMITDNNPPQGNIVVFLGDDVSTNRSHYDNIRLDAVSALDPDGDGLPSDWESDNGLDPNSAVGDDGAAGDPDGDNSSNLQEFQRGTDPQDPDSDSDGVNDGAETNTGIWVSASDTGTDPLDPDSDKDTLSDGSEVAANPFVTNPNLRDSDGDEFEDQAEIASGSDPTQAGSFPSAPDGDFIVGVNFIGGRVDGTLGASVTGAAGFIEQSNWNNLADLGGIGAELMNSQGSDTILRADWTVDDTFTIDLGPPADQNSALMHGFLKTRTGVLTEVRILNIPFEEYDVYVYADGDRIDGVASYTVNGQTFLNVGDTANWPVAAGGGTFMEIRNDSESGNYMVFSNVSGPTAVITATNQSGDFGATINAIQVVRAATDTDGDGLTDVWENANGTDPNVADADADPDGDGVNNLGEFQRGTSPQNADTDGDGYSDLVETGTGTFVSLQDTGTNPRSADTDRDGLVDGIERNTGIFAGADDPGTNPNLADTDGDAYSDSNEIAEGTNPLDPNNFPPIATPSLYFPFDDQGIPTTADLSPGGNDGSVNGEALYVAGHSGEPDDYAIAFNGFDTFVTTSVPLLDNLPAISMAGWVRFEVEQPVRSGFWGQNDTVEFGMIDGATLSWWMPNGAVDQAFGPTVPEWTHVAVIGDATGRRVYIDGVLITNSATVYAPAAAAFNFNIGGGGIWDGTGNFFAGEIDDVAVWNEALTEGDVLALALGLITPLGTSPQPVLFTITDIQVDKPAGHVTLSWNSVPNATYSVFRSTDGSVYLEVDDSIPSEGASTSYTDTSAPTDEPNLFYQVRRTD